MTEHPEYTRGWAEALAAQALHVDALKAALKEACDLATRYLLNLQLFTDAGEARIDELCKLAEVTQAEGGP